MAANRSRILSFAELQSLGLNLPEPEDLKLQYLTFTIDDEYADCGSECIPFATSKRGYILLVPPVYISDLSVGDVIQADLSADHLVERWSHIQRSNHSTIWLLRQTDDAPIDVLLSKLRDLGCRTVATRYNHRCSVDAPGSVGIALIDDILAGIPNESIAVAFPAMRHPEPTDSSDP